MKQNKISTISLILLLFCSAYARSNVVVTGWWNEVYYENTLRKWLCIMKNVIKGWIYETFKYWNTGTRRCWKDNFIGRNAI